MTWKVMWHLAWGVLNAFMGIGYAERGQTFWVGFSGFFVGVCVCTAFDAWVDR